VEEYELHLVKIEKLVKRMNELNPNIIFVLVPFREQVYDHYFDLVYSSGTRIGRFRIQEDMIEIFEKNNVSYVDLLPFMRESDVPLFFHYDSHPNQEGHKAIANILLEEVA